MEEFVNDNLEIEDLELFETKKEPKKSFQTFLRNQNKILINSFTIIDKKASILISINSTIISALLIFFKEMSSIYNGEYIGISLVIGCLISLFFALNASRPHSYYFLSKFNRKVKMRALKPEETIFVSGAASGMTESEYQIAFNKIVNNQNLQIGNQVRASFMSEKRIKKSFIYIEISYLTFMIGFFVAVTFFIIGNFIIK